MTENINKSAITGAALSCILLIIFSYFINSGFPLKLIAFAALISAAFFIGMGINFPGGIKNVTGDFPSMKAGVFFVVIGVTGGLIFAVLYRWSIDQTLLPSTFFSFTLIAASIGAMEELVFRGYVQESVRPKLGFMAVFFSTTAHAAYKCVLFMSPEISRNVDLGFLAFWTFLAGFIFGTVRHFSKSILPSLIAHVIFDIIVYADYIYAPWWVW